MPWKNGKGKTLELFRIQTEDPSSFSFRVSMAEVNSNGPFSIFPNINRILFLASGHGVILQNRHYKIQLTELWKPFYFSGEDEIDCNLINGPCVDFNVMVDRRFGRVDCSTLFVSEYEFKCDSNFLLVYDSQLEKLTVLQTNDLYHFSAATKSTLVVVSLNC